MLSVSLPCPSCSAPLILDEENAGSEVLCPDCDTRLRMPSTVSADASLTIIAAPSAAPAKTKGSKESKLGAPVNPSASPAEPASPAEGAGVPTAKSALPKNRFKSAEDERKRLARAAAAAGGAHSFKAEEVNLPVDHHPAVLPSKRTLQEPEVEASPSQPPSDATARTPVVLPAVRKSDPSSAPPEGEDRQKARAAPGHGEIGATPIRGPSQHVRPLAEVPEPAASGGTPASGLAAAETTEPQAGDAEFANDSGARGGFRLGLSRELHFSPMQGLDDDSGEAAAWGAKAENEVQAARSRRFVSLAILLALLASGGTGFYMFRQALIKPEQTASLSDDGQEDVTAAPVENVMANVEAARRVLKRFLEADTVEKMAAEVRHPEETQPRMDRFYAANPLKPRKIRTESQSWSEIRIEDTEFIRAAMELDDFIVYPVTLELIPGAEPKVDWESFVSWAEIPWKDFLRKPPEQSVDFRVTVTLDPRDQYYNYSFKGRELELLCFKLEDPGKFGSCWAYCDKDSEAASKLLFNLKRSRQQGIVNDEGKIAISCMLRLRFPPEGMKTNQVMIEQFIQDSWVKP